MKGIMTWLLAVWTCASLQAAAIRGTVVDKETKEPLIGAAVQVGGTTTGTITDIDGRFELAGLLNGKHTLIVSYVSYRTLTIDVTVNGMTDLTLELQTDAQQLGEVTVTAAARRNTENALINQQRQSLVIQTGV